MAVSPGEIVDPVVKALEDVKDKPLHVIERGPRAYRSNPFTAQLSKACQSKGFNPVMSTTAEQSRPGELSFRGHVQLGVHKMATTICFPTSSDAREQAAKIGYDWLKSHPAFNLRRNTPDAVRDLAMMISEEQAIVSSRQPAVTSAEQVIADVTRHQTTQMLPQMREIPFVINLPGNVTPQVATIYSSAVRDVAEIL